MIIVFNENGGKDYRGDILFRVYENQSKRPKKGEAICFEVLTRNGVESEYAGRYSAEHPQAVRTLLEKVVDEGKNDKITCLELSNELEDLDLRRWMQEAFVKVKRGERYSKK